MFEFLSIILELLLEIFIGPIFKPEFDLESSPEFNWFRLLLTLAVGFALAGVGIWLLLQLRMDSFDSFVLFAGLLFLASGGFPGWPGSCRFYRLPTHNPSSARC